MIDLDNMEVTLPPYKLKYGGKEVEYDALIVGYQLRVLEGVDDPEVILGAVKKAFGLEAVTLSTFDACLIMNDFKKFSQNEASEPLKKVFGRSLFSDTITDSVPEKPVT